MVKGMPKKFIEERLNNMLSDKQWSYICYLIQGAMKYGFLDYDDKDFQRIEQKLKELDGVQASSLIDDLVNEKWELVKLTLNN